MICACSPCKKPATDGNRCYVCALNQKDCRHCDVCGININAFTPTGLNLHMANHRDPVKAVRALARYESSYHRAEDSYDLRGFVV